LVILIFSLQIISVECITCLDTKGAPIDWWFMLKLPDVVGKYKGYTYLYLDSSNSTALGDLHDSKNPAANTIYQIGLYGASPVNTSSVGYVLWNDQTYATVGGKVTDHEQDATGEYFAHSKATIGFDANTGFWLAHSAPGWPYKHSITPSSWEFPTSQSIYAQHFFCVSIATAQINKISEFLLNYHAFIYDSNVPSSIPNLDSFANFANGKYTTSESSITFQSLANVNFLAFGKNGATNSDIFEDYVAPGLNSGALYVETWCCGDYGDCCQPSYCQGSPIIDPSGPQNGKSNYAYSSITIEKFSFATDLYYETKNNHAKFALSEKNLYVCPSDNNRVDTQRHRGGGTLCLQDKALYYFLYSHITGFNTTCSK